jgi:hypothetical protein
LGCRQLWRNGAPLFLLDVAHRQFASLLYRGKPSSSLVRERERQVVDVILIASGLAFFVLSIGYAFACERL